MEAFVCDENLDKLQAKYDELVIERGIAIRQYDSSPDGSIRKQIANDALRHLSAEIVKIEAEFIELLG